MLSLIFLNILKAMSAPAIILWSLNLLLLVLKQAPSVWYQIGIFYFKIWFKQCISYRRQRQRIELLKCVLQYCLLLWSMCVFVDSLDERTELLYSSCNYYFRLWIDFRLLILPSNLATLGLGVEKSEWDTGWCRFELQCAW